MSRRNGRILAVQALYSYDVGKMPLEDLLKLDWNQTESESEQMPEALKADSVEAESSASAKSETLEE